MAAKALQRRVLEQLLAGISEPVVVARVGQSEWPVVLCNSAFEVFSGQTDKQLQRQPVMDLIEKLAGADLAVEIREAIYAGEEAQHCIDSLLPARDLSIKPLLMASASTPTFYAIYWPLTAEPDSAEPAVTNKLRDELKEAEKRIRDLSREDAVTGLLNVTAFGEVLSHDWAVAAREKNKLAIIDIRLDAFDEYRDTFGPHATDSCFRRVAQTVRRCLRRSSDIAGVIAEGRLVVLSHGGEEPGVMGFAERIVVAVRELGLHHPRAPKERFVTVSSAISTYAPAETELRPAQIFEQLMQE